MGQYKVPQDVEADDKIIGFLTLKQFIYTTIGVVWAISTWLLFHAVPIVFITVGLPFSIIFLILGLLQIQGQPSETMFLAMLNYFINPRYRVWEKEPIFEVFKLELPLMQADAAPINVTEVKGQLDSLAKVLDTRGWSSKQPELQEPNTMPVINDEDRLVSSQAITIAPEPVDIHASDDILDMENNAAAQNLNLLILNQTKSIREEALQRVKKAVSQPVSKKLEDGIIHDARTEIAEVPRPIATTPSPLSETANAGIIRLAMESGELTVAQVAAQANKYLKEGQAVSLREVSSGK